MAQLAAMVGNTNGGRSLKPSKVKDKDTVPFEALEFIPSYAHYPPLMESFGRDEPLKGVDVEALRELYERRNDISSLFFNVLPWPDIRQRLGIVED
jgi:hypothetical protein